MCPARRPTAADQKPPARMHILASIRTPLWSCGGAPCLVPTPQGRSLHLPLVSLNGRSEASAMWGWGQASDRGYWPAQQRHFGCLYPRRRRWPPHGRARRHLRRWWPSRHVYAFETRSIRQFWWFEKDALSRILNGNSHTRRSESPRDLTLGEEDTHREGTRRVAGWHTQHTPQHVRNSIHGRTAAFGEAACRADGGTTE